MTPTPLDGVTVVTTAHNETIMRFTVAGRAHDEKLRPEAEVDSTVSAPRDDGDAGSRLTGLLVLMVPVAGLAWAAIGFLVYRLVS